MNNVCVCVYTQCVRVCAHMYICRCVCVGEAMCTIVYTSVDLSQSGQMMNHRLSLCFSFSLCFSRVSHCVWVCRRFKLIGLLVKSFKNREIKIERNENLVHLLRDMCTNKIVQNHYSVMCVMCSHVCKTL